MHRLALHDILLDPAAGIPTKTKWVEMYLSATIFPFKSNYREISRKGLADKKSKSKELWFDYTVKVFSSRFRAKPRLGLLS